MTSQSPLGRSDFPKSALTSDILSAFWSSFSGQGYASNSTNNSRSQFSIAALWSATDFTQNISLSAISKILGFQNFLCGPPSAKMQKVSDFSCLGILRLPCVRFVVSGTKDFSLNYFIRTFIPSEFQ